MAQRSATIRGHEIPLDLLIGGEWVTTDDGYAVTNPADGSVIAEPTSGGVDHALRALEAAAAAQAEWADWAPRARADLMHRAHRLLLEREAAFVETMTLEREAAGRVEGRVRPLRGLLPLVRRAGGAPARQLRRRLERRVPRHRRAPAGRSLLPRDPVELPLLMSARKAGAALGAGCTVVMKTARDTPLTQALFAQVLHDAGFPPAS